ncbi:MAG: ATP synthase F1 subunit gamma [Pyrinomonadaceae bacterium]
MANLLDIRRRIKSVKNTQQITKAMKMVSAAKLKRAQDRVVSARPFAVKMREVMGDLASRTSDDYSHPLLDARGDERYLVILITSDKGLCGAFNTNVVKAASAFLRDNAGKQVEMIPVGRKGREFFRSRNVKFVTEYIGLTNKGRIDFAEAMEIAREVIRLFGEDTELDKVFLIYNEFKSVLQQRVVVEQLLPVAHVGAQTSNDALTATATSDAQAVQSTDYIYEQTPESIFGILLPMFIETQVFRALLESVASEQGARMTAMDAASKNAGELIGSLTLNMNRIRQAAITNEIIEVVSGASVSV